MRTRYLLLFALITLCFLHLQCGKDSERLTLPITDTGANTFGCLVDGRVMIPRDGVVSINTPYPHKGIEAIFGGSKNNIDLKFYNAKDNKPSGFFLDIHLFDSSNIQPHEYTWQKTSYGTANADDGLHHVYGSFYDSDTKDYAWFGSYDGSGSTIITRFDTANHIISGTFSGRLRKDGGTKEVTVTNGRFDINWVTVLNKKFP